MSYSETVTYEDLKRILETIPLSTITYGRGEVGEIKPFAGSTIPTGWLLCDGSAVSRTTYSELFTVIGTTYGTGDGSTTFNLPDLRNRFMVGAGDEYELNDKGGDKNVTLDATMIPAHTHGNKSLSGTFDIRKWGSAGDDIVGRSGIVSYTSATLSANCKATGSQNPNAVQRVTIDASHEHTSVGGGQAHENRPPYIGINFIIYAKNTKTVVTPQIDLFYPVGAYFETSDSTFDPNVKWGGTWVLTNGGLLSASPNVTRIESNDQAEKTTTNPTTGIDLLTIQHTSKTGLVWVCGMSTVKTSRYTSRIHLDINGTDCGGQTTNIQTYTRLTAITQREVPIDTPFTVALRLTSQDTGTTASRSSYTNDQLFISDVPKVTGYCWHRTA